MISFKFIREMIFKQKKFILIFIIVNTILAIGLKVILINEYEKKGLQIGRLKLSIGYALKQDKITKKYKKIFILEPIEYSFKFKDQFVDLKINMKEKDILKTKLYLYSVSTDKNLITKYLLQAVEKINNLEQSIILKKISTDLKISNVVYAKPLDDIIISNNPYYLNNYFVISVFLLSLIASISLAIYREKYLNDK